MKLKDLVHIKTGKPQNLTTKCSEGYPIYGSSGLLKHKVKDFLTDKPAIILSRTGTLGVYYCDVPFWTLDSTYILTKKDNNIKLKNLYLLLTCIDFEEYNYYINRKTINYKIINNIDIDLNLLNDKRFLKTLNKIYNLSKKIEKWKIKSNKYLNTIDKIIKSYD